MTRHLQEQTMHGAIFTGTKAGEERTIELHEGGRHVVQTIRVIDPGSNEGGSARYHVLAEKPLTRRRQ